MSVICDPINPAPPVMSTFLIGIAAQETLEEGQKDDFEIKPKRPFANILQIVIDPFRQICLPTKTSNLCQPRDPCLYHVLLHILRDLLLELLNKIGSLRT